MSTKIFKIISSFIIISALFFIGCGDDKNPRIERTDPSFLIGTWVNEIRGVTFTINANYSFICNLSTIEPDGSLEGDDAIPAQVQGNLDYKTSGLGPNDFVLRNMRPTDVDEDSPFFEGNDRLVELLKPFDNLMAILSPKENYTQFEFDAQGNAGMLANLFFGGIYTKQVK